MKSKYHYSEQAKANIIKMNTCGCTGLEARIIADATMGFTFAMLKELSKAIVILAKGN